MAGHVESLADADLTGLRMPIVVAYRHPAECPHGWVARVFDIDRPTPTYATYGSGAELRADAERLGLTWVPRMAGDDPHVAGAFL